MCASTKQWLAALAALRNRGVADVCIVACDGLKGLPDVRTPEVIATSQ